MSPYLFLYIYIAVFACISWRLRKNSANVIYFITLFFLFLFLALRYGQGTDYFAYEYLFNYWKGKDIYNINEFLEELNYIHGEFIWSWLGYILNETLKLNFQHFVCLLAVFVVCELYCYFNRYCRPNKMWAILLAFPTLYLTYMFSGLRQGLVICTFMGVMLPLLQTKQLLKYYLCAFIMMFIHSSAIALFIIPVIIMFRVKTLFLGILISLIVGITLGASMSQIVSETIPIRNILARMGVLHVFFPAIAERFLMFVFISYLYHKKKFMNSSTDKMLYKIYMCSVMIYLLFINYSLVASRLSVAPRMVEIALILHCINKLPKMRGAICCLILVLNIVMYCKNINAYINQGGYQNVNIFTYPYVSIYNKDMIHRYIQVPNFYIQ